MPIFKSVLLHLFPIFVFSISILGCSKKLGGEVKQTVPIPPAAFSFKQHEIVTGSAKHQTVLTGFLMGGTIAELAMAVLLGDVNGDGHSDLLVGKNWEELHIFLGVSGPELLAKKPQKVKVAMPNDERNIWLVNLNKDNKQDILIYHRSTTEQYRVTMLIAK